MLQRVVMNRAWTKPFKGVCDFTAADNLIALALKQAGEGRKAGASGAVELRS